MKRTAAVATVILALLRPAPAAEVRVVSVNFYTDDNALAPEEEAGAVPARHWNSVLTTGTGQNPWPGTLRDSLNRPTAIAVHYDVGYADNDHELRSGTGPNVKIMAGISPRSLNNRGSVFSYAQVLLEHLLGGRPTQYDLYVYLGTGYSGSFMGGRGDIRLSTDAGAYTTADDDYPTGQAVAASAPFRTLNSNWTSSPGTPVYDAAVGFIPSTDTINGNYVKFTGLAADTLVITPHQTFLGHDFDTCSIKAFQIVYPLDVQGGLLLLVR